MTRHQLTSKNVFILNWTLITESFSFENCSKLQVLDRKTLGVGGYLKPAHAPPGRLTRVKQKRKMFLLCACYYFIYVYTLIFPGGVLPSK